MKIAIIGGGNAGMTLAAYLSNIGFDLSVYSRHFQQNQINKKLIIESTGAISFRSTINQVSDDLKTVIDEVELIIIAVPGYAQDEIFEQLIPLLQNDVTICLLPDNYGSIRLKNKMQQMRSKVWSIISFNTVMFACRKLNDHQVIIKGIKREVYYHSTGEISLGLSRFFEAFPTKFIKAKTIIEIGLSNMNPIVHTPIALLNAGLTSSSKGQFDFYQEGVTESIANVIQQLDVERIAIGKALGTQLASLLENMNSVYGSKENSLFKALTYSQVHAKDLAPKSLKSRYIYEDVPYGLVPMSCLGNMIGVKTKVIDCLIVLASTMCEIDFMRSSPINEKQLFDEVKGYIT